MILEIVQFSSENIVTKISWNFCCKGWFLFGLRTHRYDMVYLAHCPYIMYIVNKCLKTVLYVDFTANIARIFLYSNYENWQRSNLWMLIKSLKISLMKNFGVHEAEKEIRCEQILFRLNFAIGKFVDVSHNLIDCFLILSWHFMSMFLKKTHREVFTFINTK